jgi:predicted Zn-dependent protease
LAFGTQEQLTEAQQLLKGTIHQAGPQPLLMDTLAVLHLRQGEPQNAVDVLLAMLPDAPSDGLPLLHLSQAWLELGQIEMARYALSMARNRQVDLLPLLPPDRRLLQQLDQQLRL